MLKVLHCQIDLKLVSVLFLVLSLCHVHPAEVCEWGSEEINTWGGEVGGVGGEGSEVR